MSKQELGKYSKIATKAYLTLKRIGFTEIQIAEHLCISRPTLLRNRRNCSLFSCGDLDVMTRLIREATSQNQHKGFLMTHLEHILERVFIKMEI